MAGQTCGSCRHFSRVEGVEGVCARYPPVTLYHPELDPPTFRSGFTATNEGLSCGEHRPAGWWWRIRRALSAGKG